MNLLHISDMHFGSRHWTGNPEILLKKLNSYAADVVINTGDSTTDSLENEFEDAGNFLKSLTCPHVISVVGNHDKRNMRSQDFFNTYLASADKIHPLNAENCHKKKIYLDEFTTGIEDRLTDFNFIKSIVVNNRTILVIGLDTTEIFQDNGFVDDEILNTISRKIDGLSYDDIILLYHHSIIDTDSDPLYNSEKIVDFIQKHKIKHAFCGHTHRLKIVQSTDVINKHSFTQYKNGSLSARNTPADSNMFLFYENFASENMKLHLIRMFNEGEDIRFEEEELISGT